MDTATRWGVWLCPVSSLYLGSNSGSALCHIQVCSQMNLTFSHQTPAQYAHQKGMAATHSTWSTVLWRVLSKSALVLAGSVQITFSHFFTQRRKYFDKPASAGYGCEQDWCGPSLIVGRGRARILSLSYFRTNKGAKKNVRCKQNCRGNVYTQLFTNFAALCLCFDCVSLF